MNASIDDPKYTAYLLGELDPQQRAGIERELENNADLRRQVDDLRAVADGLKQALAQEPGVGLEPVQRQAILEAARNRPAARRRLRLPCWLIPAISGIAASLVLALLALRHMSRPGGDELAVLSIPTPSGQKIAARETEFEAVDVAMDGLPALDIGVDAGPPADRIAGPEPLVTASPVIMRGLFASRSERRREPVFSYSAGGTLIPHRPPGAVHPAGEGAESAPFLSPSLDDFPEQTDNRFIRVVDHPLSTFSIDVDTASYAVMRKFLNEGRLPPRDAIRIEELVNYFPYDYAPPRGGTPFAAHLAVAPCPWRTEHHLVRIAIKGRELAPETRPPLNLVFLIDVSGSMRPANRLPLVKRSMQALARQLDHRDHVAIVVYAGAAGMILPPTRGDETHAITDALERLSAGGSTAGSRGIVLAYEVAKQHFHPDAVNRVILCTDGDFNVGITQRGDLEKLIEEQARSGVFLTVLGFGMGNYKDATLELLSNKGNGNYAYIDDFAEARKVLVDQMLGTLVTIAKDVKIQVEFNPARVAGYRLIGYENRLLKKEDFSDDRVDAGDIGAGHTVTAFYEVIPAGLPVTGAPPVDDLKYQPRPDPPTESVATDEFLTVKLRYKEPDGDTSSLLSFPLPADRLAGMETEPGFEFAAAVAAFGQRLRDNPYLGDFGYDAVLEIAASDLGDDPFGYRVEFLKLVRNAKAIAGR